MKKTSRIMDFLQTDILSADFTSLGLRQFFLSDKLGLNRIDLKLLNEREGFGPHVELIIAETLNFIETGRHNMPLDLTAFTEFQRSVFEVVKGVESGEIITYKDVAVALGKPGAAQAVGNAIAKNPVSYFLPTHRIFPQRGIGICRSSAGHNIHPSSNRF